MSKYILGKLNKDKSSFDLKGWEEVPDEDLWEDGELNQHQVGTKILHHVMKEGNWKLIRRTDGSR